MADNLASALDGTYLLSIERLTPENLASLRGWLPNIESINSFMGTVQTALYNYEKGYTAKVVINPVDLQTYIQNIREITVRIGGGYDSDGVTKIAPLAASILPDLLTTLRSHQLTLCQLYGTYVDSQGTVVGPIDTVQIENTGKGAGKI